jgi:xanthine dehydrogenase accessory factor
MDLYQQIADRKTAGKPFALATLVKTTGSAPRDIGAKMLVFPDGSILGTIGGGTFEKLVIEDCLALFAKEETFLLKHYRLTESGPDAIGMFCGGEADVFIEITPAPDRLLIFGGGHIGRDLTRISSGLGFRIAIIDERPEIIAQYKPPVETILTDDTYDSNFPSLDNKCYVVIVTHGHKCDKLVMEKVIKTNCAYIGMIGSKTKIAKTFSLLEESGIDKGLFSRVHSPIGLDIGAEGPLEIAIAIAAEIISVKRASTKKHH